MYDLACAHIGGHFAHMSTDLADEDRRKFSVLLGDQFMPINDRTVFRQT